MTLKNSTLSVEKCAETEGEDLLTQWMHVYDMILGYVGKPGSPLLMEAVVKDNAVTSLKQTNQRRFLALSLNNNERPNAGQRTNSYSTKMITVTAVVVVTLLV